MRLPALRSCAVLRNTAAGCLVLPYCADRETTSSELPAAYRSLRLRQSTRPTSSIYKRLIAAIKMSIKSESFSSFSTGAEEKYMSPRAPSSVGASDLERLALERPGSSRSSMVVTTRSGAKREAATRGESSRGSAAKRDKGKQKESSSSTKPERRTGQPSRSSAAQNDPGDDDGSDDDDDDDESDDEEEQRPARPVSWSYQHAVAAVSRLFLIYEPSQHSLEEFTNEDTKRSEVRQVVDVYS